LCPHLALWDLGAQALRLIKDIGRRANLFVPPALTHESSWATMIITSFLRSAIKLISSKFVNVLQFSSGIISLMIYFNSLLMPSRVVRMSMLWIMEISMVSLVLKCGCLPFLEPIDDGKNVFQCFWSDPKTRVFKYFWVTPPSSPPPGPVCFSMFWGLVKDMSRVFYCFSEALFCFCHLGFHCLCVRWFAVSFPRVGFLPPFIFN